MNIICICLDTFRADALYPEDALAAQVETPNLDRFLKDAVWFREAFGEGLPTLQMRRGCFTGRRSFPWRFNFDRRGHWHHAYGWHKIPPEQDTLAEILLRHGYATGLVADSYHIFKPTMNYTRGFLSFDFLRGQENDNWKSGPLSLILEQAAKHTPNPAPAPGKPLPLTLYQYLHNQRGRKSEEDYQCARVFRSAMNWIDDNADNGPFFLWVDSFDPHEPWDPPLSYADRYCPGYKGIDYILPPGGPALDKLTDKEKQRIRALYLGEVTFVDKWAGAFLDHLKKKALYDSSLIFIVSDHGTQILDRGRFGKQPMDLYRFNTRLTWTMRHADAPKGKPIDGFVQNHDLAPTILGLLGVEAPMEGRSFWPLVEGDRSVARDHVVTGWAGFGLDDVGAAGVRDHEWNAIFNLGRPATPPRLFDLKADPAELNDVAATHSDVIARQQKRLEAVLGGTLPFTFNEKAGGGPAPSAVFYLTRVRSGMRL